jgi:hypothetical protein
VSFGFGSGFGSGFESGFESWIRIRIQILDLKPDQKQAKTSFSQTKKQIEEVGTAFLLELGRHYEIWPHSKPQIFLGHKYFYRAFCSVADPDPESGAFLNPGSGMGRKSASGSRMNNPNHIFYSLETIFLVVLGLKYLSFLMRIQDPGWRQIGSGMEKVGSGINIPDPQHCFFESCVL